MDKKYIERARSKVKNRGRKIDKALRQPQDGKTERDSAKMNAKLSGLGVGLPLGSENNTSSSGSYSDDSIL